MKRALRRKPVRRASRRKSIAELLEQHPLLSSQAELLQLLAKVDPGISEPSDLKPLSLTWGERRAVAQLIFAKVQPLIKNNRPAHRPAKQQEKFFAALDVELEIDRQVPESAARSAAAHDWGLTKHQMNHAMKDHRHQARAVIAHMSERRKLRGLRMLVKQRRRRSEN